MVSRLRDWKRGVLRAKSCYHFSMLRFLVTFMALFSVLSMAHAEDDYKLLAKQEAQRAIDACWEPSKEDVDSGVTVRMRQGTQDAADCMEKHIIYLAETYLYPKSPNLVEETKQDLENIRMKYFGLYWNLYNSMDVCRPSCGTMHYVRSDSKAAHLLENIIHDIYVQMDLAKESYR